MRKGGPLHRSRWLSARARRQFDDLGWAVVRHINCGAADLADRRHSVTSRRSGASRSTRTHAAHMDILDHPTLKSFD